MFSVVCHKDKLDPSANLFWIKIYSLRFKIKCMFGHKLRYKIKVTFGEIYLKLRQTNWNVARINVNVVVDKLLNQIAVYTCLIIDIWTQRQWHTSTRFYAFRCHPPKMAGSQIGAKKFQLYYGHPQLAGKHLVRPMQCTQFCAKSAKNDLKPIYFVKRNFYFETEGVQT